MASSLPLAFVEIWINKIQSLYRISDYLQLLWRSLVAGAITLAILGSDGPLVLVAAGTFILAMLIQILRMVARPVVINTSHGIGVPVMSMLEDLLCAVTTILAVHVPLLALAFAAFSGYLLFKAYRKIRTRHFMREAAAMLPAINVSIHPMPPAQLQDETRSKETQ